MKKVMLLACLLCVIVGCSSPEVTVKTENTTVDYKDTVKGQEEQVEVKKQELEGKMTVREVELQKLADLEGKFKKFTDELEQKEQVLVNKIKSFRNDSSAGEAFYHVPICGQMGYDLISEEARDILRTLASTEFLRIINDIEYLIESSNSISYQDAFVTEGTIQTLLDSGSFYSDVVEHLKTSVIFSFEGQSWSFVNINQAPISFKKDGAYIWLIQDGTVIQLPDGSYRVFQNGLFVGYNG